MTGNCKSRGARSNHTPFDIMDIFLFSRFLHCRCNAAVPKVEFDSVEPTNEHMETISYQLGYAFFSRRAVFLFQETESLFIEIMI